MHSSFVIGEDIYHESADKLERPPMIHRPIYPNKFKIK